MLTKLLLFLCCSCPALFAADQARVVRGHGFLYTRLGNPVTAAVTPEDGFFLAGGGRDPDEAFAWLCAKTRNGDVLVLRAIAFDNYNPYLRRICPAVNSVATLIVTREGAWDPVVAEIIRGATALFISGGNQADYVNFWLDTPVQTEINGLVARHVPVAGTSAGLHILSEFVYTGSHGDARSLESLVNPFEERITLIRDFLSVPLLAGTVAEAHLRSRDRMGRAIVFLARASAAGWGPIVSGIFLDESTALLVEPDGHSRLVGSGSAYFVRANTKPERCEPGRPLIFHNIHVYRLPQGGAFDLWSWTGSGGVAYTIHVQNGVLGSTQEGGAVY